MKLALLLAIGFVCFLGSITNAQSTACTIENDVAMQAIGSTGIHKNAATRTAIDIDVQANEHFYLDQIVARLLSNTEITSVDIALYADNGNVPGNQLNAISDISPTSNPIVGTTFNLSARIVTIDFEPILLSGGPNGTKYWLTLSAIGQDPNDETISWEISGETFIGDYTMRFSNGSWYVITFNTAQYEAVYSLNGICEEAEETELSIDLFPNPTADSVTIQSTSALSSVSIIDVSGRVIRTVTANGNQVTLNVEDIAEEVLFIRIFSKEGEVSTEKLLKQ